MTPTQLTYGNVPVPYSVLWSDEDVSSITPDPMVNGMMAMCNPVARGSGRPMFGKPHMQRQREVIINGLCDLCAKPLKGHTKVSLSHARERRGANGLCVMQVEPLLHKECAAISLQHCPSLKRDIAGDTLQVRLVTRYEVQIAQLTGEATMEFAGVRHPGAVGHAKVILIQWADKTRDWLF